MPHMTAFLSNDGCIVGTARAGSGVARQRIEGGLHDRRFPPIPVEMLEGAKERMDG